MASPESSAPGVAEAQSPKPRGTSRPSRTALARSWIPRLRFPSDFDQRLSEPLDGQASSSSVSVGSPTRTRAGSSSGPLKRVDDEDAEEWTEADMVAGSHLPSIISQAQMQQQQQQQQRKPPRQRRTPHQRPPGPLLGARLAEAAPRLNGPIGVPFWQHTRYPPSRSSSPPLVLRPPHQHQPHPTLRMMPSLTPSRSQRTRTEPLSTHHRPARSRKEARAKEAQQKDAAKTAKLCRRRLFLSLRAGTTVSVRQSQSARARARPARKHARRSISPMPTSSKRTDSYFGLTAPKPISSSNGKDSQSGQADQKRDAGSGSFSPASPSTGQAASGRPGQRCEASKARSPVICQAQATLSCPRTKRKKVGWRPQSAQQSPTRGGC